MKTRRNFLKAAALGAAAVALPPLARAAGNRRPNFLFILTDDQRWDIMSCVQKEQGARARFPWLKTPHLDRLAAEGVRFRHAFVVNSLCSPSRASFLTGCYGHVNGIVNNHTAFPLDNVTHASVLRAAGYTTGYIGKWHMGSQVERPGFDFAASFLGQGKYFDCPIVVNGQTKPSTGWVDDVGTDYAIDFLTQYKDKPFALCLGYKATHGPFSPPPRRENDYANESARPVPNLDVPAIYHGAVPAKKRAAPAAEGAVKTNLGYFRCIAAMDDNVGRLLKALDDLGLTQDTVVVFTGDNGYYLGEHQLGDKRSAYEESLRIPLLVRWPRRVRGGRTEDRMALNIDLAPTFLDLADLPVPKKMQGRSWRPLLEEAPNADWRSAFFYAYFAEKNFGAPFVTAVRTESAKLIRYPGHEEWTELFDLGADPYELKNLWQQPDAADLRQKMEAEYERQKTAIGFRVPENADKANESQGAPAAAVWVLDYRFDKDQGAQVSDASGQKNHGTAKGTTLAEGREGRKARRFDGKSWIEVGKPASLNPGVGAWTVEATCKAEQPDGVVLAHGGATMGYLLAIEGGQPVFVVNADHKTSRVVVKREVTGQWVRLTAQWSGKNLSLAVDDQPASKAKLQAAPDKLPNDGLQIGSDERSQILEKPLPKFTGLMERVRICSGAAPSAGS